MRVYHLGLTMALLLGAAMLPPAAQAQSAASDWIKGNSSRIRLIAASPGPGAAPGQLWAGVEIELDEGWKTYWRNPGDAGGVPPELDWSASTNIAKTEVLYPAPMRLHDANGDNIGYKHGVILPVRVTPADAAKPVQIDLKILFGVCKNICIPEERHLTLVWAADAGGPQEVADALAGAVARVPVDPAASADAPHVAALALGDTAGKPTILIDLQFPKGSAGADLFAESPDGKYLPMTEKLASRGDGTARYAIDLSKTDDFKSPSGQKLKLTIVSEAGASETVRTIP